MDRRESAEMAVSLGDGVGWIHLLARWADGEPIGTNEDPRDGLERFAAAAEKLSKLEAEGRVFAGRPGYFSAANLALIARVRELIRSGLESEEARSSREEIGETARRLLAALAPRDGEA